MIGRGAPAVEARGVLTEIEIESRLIRWRCIVAAVPPRDRMECVRRVPFSISPETIRTYRHVMVQSDKSSARLAAGLESDERIYKDVKVDSGRRLVRCR